MVVQFLGLVCVFSGCHGPLSGFRFVFLYFLSHYFGDFPFEYIQSSYEYIQSSYSSNIRNLEYVRGPYSEVYLAQENKQ